jgi:UDP-glucose 4-epimerase
VEYLPFDEEHPRCPLSPYGVSKMAAEDYCRVFHNIFEVELVSLRYYTVYGPRMRPDLAISIFTHRALRNEKIEIFGTGENSRDFTYIDDIVKANTMFMDRGRSGIYNIGFGSGTSINELSEKIIGLANSTSTTYHSSSQLGDVEHTLASADLLKKELGWHPTTSIDEGLGKYVDYVRSNPDY